MKWTWGTGPEWQWAGVPVKVQHTSLKMKEWGGILFVLLFCVVLYLCCRDIYENDERITPSRDFRRLSLPAVNSHIEYYQDTALNFIIKYGLYYRLFDLFFITSSGKSPVLVQDFKLLNGSSSAKSDITNSYRVKSYKNFNYRQAEKATVTKLYSELEFEYNPKATSNELMLYNNKYRFGPKIDDRFMTITFDRDPWTEAQSDSPAFIYFVGVNTELSEQYTYVCTFRSPVKAQTEVSVERHLRNVINQVTANSIIKCPVPWSLSSKLTDKMTEVVVSLEKRGKSANEVLLGDIHIPRLHALDRRRFTYVVQTMVEVLDDAMVVEWLVYNIMLGMEHFYIYYNAKAAQLDIEHSLLKPFLDANIITLIYFPFLHTVHFMNVQHAALNSYLRQFGRYTKFVGFWDVDEFFLPADKFLSNKNKLLAHNISAIQQVSSIISWNDQIPGIMFNTLDMDCAVGSENFYQGGDNLLVKQQQPSPIASNSKAGGGQPGKNVREAVTTHCFRTGFYFRELVHGHGKMLLATARINYVMSPHRLNHPLIEWTDGFSGGLIRHFNRFRNTDGAIKNKMYWAEDISVDYSLRNFTLYALKELVGISTAK